MGRFSLGVSEFTTWPWSFEEDVRAYGALGAETIEITEAKLNRDRLREQLDMVSAAGLRVASVQATVHGIFPTKLQPEPLLPEDRVRHIRVSMERFAGQVPPSTPFVIITGAPPSGDVETCTKTVVEALRELSSFAAERQMRIALEPLNPYLLNVDSAIWSMWDALKIVEDVDAENCGICLDSWNVWENRDLKEAIERAGRRIFLVQISDFRPPRAFYDRLIPGDGEIPLDSILATLRRIDYAGPYVVEILSSESLPDSLWRSDLHEVVRTSIRRLEHLCERIAA
jgi:sugar phosphate isomerase/epimerase